jgi:hypothetical protein
MPQLLRAQLAEEKYLSKYSFIHFQITALNISDKNPAVNPFCHARKRC